MSDEQTPNDDQTLIAEIEAAHKQVEDGHAEPPAAAAPVSPPEPPKADATPAPLTPEAVAGEKAEEPTLPDSTVLRDRLQALTTPAAPQADPRDAQIAQLQAQLQTLTAARLANPVQFLQQQTGLTPEQLIEQQNAPDSVAQRALDEARAQREQTEAYLRSVQERDRERAQEDIRRGVISYVESQGDRYRLLNLGYQHLAADLMFANPSLSETEAAAEADGKLLAFVEKAAAALGYVKAPNSEVQVPSENNSPTTLTPQTGGVTPPSNFNDMSFEDRDQALIAML